MYLLFSLTCEPKHYKVCSVDHLIHKPASSSEHCVYCKPNRNRWYDVKITILVLVFNTKELYIVSASNKKIIRFL